MLIFINLFVLLNCHLFFVQCKIPSLSVRQVDRKTIEQRRNDNFELCQRFDAEDDKLSNYQSPPAYDHQTASFLYETKYRYKRQIDTYNPIEYPETIQVHGPKLRAKRNIQEMQPLPIPDADREFFRFYGRIKRHIKESPDVEDNIHIPLDGEKEDHRGRMKREAATTIKSRLNLEDQARVESLVDKLYDEKDGSKKRRRLNYRRNNIQLENQTTEVPTGGRKKMFFFAPHILKADGERSEERLVGPRGPKIDWPKYWNHGIIPYFIDPKTYDAHLASKITNAFDYFEKATCIRLQRLREKPADAHSMKKVEWVYITNPSGIRQCVHSNEKKPNIGVQIVVFGYDCMSLGEILHEVMHTLGFSHEHTRPDRDRYITVLWDNIKPGYKKYFEARKEDPLYTLPYDYASVLHYPARAFSRNGQLTILADGGLKIGQREGISETDVEKVSMIFGNDCMLRNKNYLLTTCPSVIKNKDTKSEHATKEEIDEYFKNRVWPYGVVYYKFNDMMEFSADERENIQAVMQHIERETCLKFENLDKMEEEELLYEDEDLVPPASGQVLEGDIIEEENTAKLNEEGAGEVNPADNTAKSNGDVNEQVTNDEGIILPRQGLKYTDDLLELAVFEKLKAQVENAEGNGESTTVQQLEVVEKAALRNKHKKYMRSDNKTAKKIGPKDQKSNDKEKPAANAQNNSPLAARSKRAARIRMASRRHSSDFLLLTRTAHPGCVCPPPGKPTGQYDLELSQDCFNSVNDLLHVFTHLLGLDHQHNMHDRDSFLHIIWSNLTDEVTTDLKKKLPPAASAGFPYDYQSVMHFPWLQIKHGVTNIMYPIWNDGWAMGHWQGLSSTDVQKLNLIYFDQCSKRKKENGS